MNPMMMSVALIVLACLVGCASPDQPVEPRSDASPATKPDRILGLEDGWELAEKAEYSAVQGDGAVTIIARGEAPTAGYEVKLVMSPLRIYPPQWMLAWKKPDGMAAQVITPFEATASFKAGDSVRAVIVSDAAGRHEVKVAQP